jgi:hypothetical protein
MKRSPNRDAVLGDFQHQNRIFEPDVGTGSNPLFSRLKAVDFQDYRHTRASKTTDMPASD